ISLPNGGRDLFLSKIAAPSSIEGPALRLDQGVLRSLAFAPDGRSVALACDGGIVRLWHPQRSSHQPRSISHAPDEAWCVAFAPDGKTLASGGDSRHHPETLKLSNVATGTALWT